MIFKDTWKQVLDGTKIQTRRPIKYNESIITNLDPLDISPDKVVIDSIASNNTWTTEGRLKWEVGHTYAIQPGRGKPSIGRIRLLNIQDEFLHDISEEDAIAEGIESTGSYPELYSFANLEIGLHLTAISAFRDLWNGIYKGTEYAWSKNPQVWVLEFELVEKY